MTFMPFSIPEHVSLLLSGSKRQTTRQPRKKPLKVGDILHCYYKPRWMKSCGNCITSCAFSIRFNPSPGHHHCEEWCNFFGTAKVAGILHCVPDPRFSLTTLSYDEVLAPPIHETGFERGINGFDTFSKSFLEAWARADGFANLQDAHKWFTKSTGTDQWMFLPWDIIIFEPDWVVK